MPTKTVVNLHYGVAEISRGGVQWIKMTSPKFSGGQFRRICRE